MYVPSTVLNGTVNTAFNSSLMLVASYHQTDTAKAHLEKNHIKHWKSLKINNLCKECDTKAFGYHSCVKVSRDEIFVSKVI